MHDLAKGNSRTPRGASMSARLTRRGFLLASGVAAGVGSMYLTGCSVAPASGAQAPRPAGNAPGPHSSAALKLQGWPGPVVPGGLGVNLHLNSSSLAQIPRIAALGFRFVRLDFLWSQVERQKGRYDFSSYESIINALIVHGIRPLCILGYSNALYEQTPAAPSTDVGPHTDAVRQAFARFAAAAAAKFQARGVVWEVWNEPDNVRFWAPAPSAAAYMALAKATVPAIRRADPSALVIAPALTGMTPQYASAWSYLESCLSSGLAGLVDGLSVHPYRLDAPENATADYQHLRSLIARYAPKDKKKLPIVNSEWGYSTTWISSDQQATYLARLSLVNLLNGLPASIWYDWQDDGNDPHQQEDNFGLLTWNGHQKPAYAAAQTLMHELAGFWFSRRLLSGADYGLLFTNGVAKKQVLWTTGNAHLITLSINAPSITITGTTGGQRTQPIIQGKTILQITGNPQYISPGA